MAIDGLFPMDVALESEPREAPSDLVATQPSTIDCSRQQIDAPDFAVDLAQEPFADPTLDRLPEPILDPKEVLPADPKEVPIVDPTGDHNDDPIAPFIGPLPDSQLHVPVCHGDLPSTDETETVDQSEDKPLEIPSTEDGTSTNHSNLGTTSQGDSASMDGRVSLVDQSVLPPEEPVPGKSGNTIQPTINQVDLLPLPKNLSAIGAIGAIKDSGLPPFELHDIREYFSSNLDHRLQVEDLAASEDGEEQFSEHMSGDAAWNQQVAATRAGFEAQRQVIATAMVDAPSIEIVPLLMPIQAMALESQDERLQAARELHQFNDPRFVYAQTEEDSWLEVDRGDEIDGQAKPTHPMLFMAIVGLLGLPRTLRGRSARKNFVSRDKSWGGEPMRVEPMGCEV